MDPQTKHTEAKLISVLLCHTLVLLLLCGCIQENKQIETPAEINGELNFEVELDVISSGYDGISCWIHPRAGRIPDNPDKVVLLMQRWVVEVSDLFLPLNEIRTNDMGISWTSPFEHKHTLGRHQLSPTRVEGISDFTPKWHQSSGTLLGTGHTVVYQDNKLLKERPRATVWSIYDSQNNTWSSWERLSMPDSSKFYNAGAGSTQRVDLTNGDILLPIYFKSKGTEVYSTTIVRCSFDGKQLKYLEHGNELSVEIDRGLYEPSLTFYDGRFFLTMRNDQQGYVASGENGLTFASLKPWTFDDGEPLGNYNTQQHWVTHNDGLFLVYTRRGANNDHVTRHRAPLFIARVDPKKLCIIRDSEQILVPEKGAMLGNFSVMNYSEGETWVTVAEAMHPKGVEKQGADARVYAAKIQWNTPNKTWDKY